MKKAQHWIGVAPPSPSVFSGAASLICLYYDFFDWND
jgi:hypothetical protein